MRFEPALTPGTLIRRYKRFLSDVRLDDGSTIVAHCANSGAMTGCQKPGSRVYLSYHPDPKRKLKYTWEMVRVGRTWVGINTALPNRIVTEAIESGHIPELTGYATIKREVRYGENSRIDVQLQSGRQTCFVEVKSVTLSNGSTALFPDAVTARGTKHLNELMNQVKKGDRAVMLYLVQRTDCDHFRPADGVDPLYGATLREAVAVGVEAIAYEARVSPTQIRLNRTIPVDLSP